jgi:ferric-dicitrate binding protein FerR (iron transport regulator)
MTDNRHHNDEIDRAAEQIRSQKIDDVTARDITDRVRRRLGIGRGEPHPLTSCADYQEAIPAYVAGTLPEARALLVGDHTRECVPCRRVLMEARGVEAPTSSKPLTSRRSRFAAPLLRVAAAIILVLGGVGSLRLTANVRADRSLRATIEVIDGSLQRVRSGSIEDLDFDAVIRSHQDIRTGKNSGAVIRLADGSRVEVDERSQLALRASRRGTTIDLERGNIIVNAADQGEKRLLVTTNDCEVAVKGTIFAVNHGLKGSRVSVIEGSVEVSEGSSHALLRPGDQITTDDRLRLVPLEQEISWSRDAAQHKALLRELMELRRAIVEAVDHAPPRTSTFLLDLAPPDTLLYAAMPNLTADLDEARAAFYERLASSEVLAEWWQEIVVANGVDAQIDELIDRLKPIGEALGAEAVITVSASVIRGQGAPLFMAEVDDPSSFVDALSGVVDRANAEAGDQTVAVLVDDPRTAVPTVAEVYFWVENNLFAAAGSLDSLQQLALRVDHPEARAFVGSPLHTQLTENYAGGVSWLLGADLAAAVAEGTSGISPEEAAAMDRLGLLDATTLVIERHRDGDWYATNAEVRFSQPRHGIIAWLAKPALMGSLDFVSPNAYVAASAVTKDAAVMFDDILDLIASQEDGALEAFRLFEQNIGIDLREDLAATFGGEATFALDGPMLPVPSWKLIVEVRDPGTLIHTIDRAVGLVNHELAGQEEAPLVFDSIESGGRTFYALSREGFDRQVLFTIVEGYLVAAPNQAVIEAAINQRSSGVSLATSSVFRSLLPDNGYTNCSALVYRDLGSLLDAVPPEVIGELEFVDALSDDLSKGLVCVFGEDDRITASATGGSLVGLASTLGMTGASFAEKRHSEEVDTTEAVSSL